MKDISIDDIVKQGYCLGCGLCVSVLGKDRLLMVENPDGFLVPKNIGESKAGYERDLCPGITVRQTKKKTGLEKIYGPYLDLKVGFSSDPGIRFKASSGGVVTALVCFLFDNSLIDGVLHVGKDRLNPLKSAAYFSRTKEEAIKNCGSRYAPTSLLVSLSDILNEGYKISIVGKPCDIVGVRLFLNKFPQYSKQVVLTLSFMCMGVPSYNGTYLLADKLGCAMDNVKDFWYRGNGWPGSATIIDKSGKAHSCSYEESWGKLLSPVLNFRCKICPDGYGEFADISSGDAWYLKNGAPDFTETDGRSIIFVRTSRGEAIFQEATRKGYIKAGEYDINELKSIQVSQYVRKLVFVSRILALKFLGDNLLQIRGFSYCSNLLKAGFRRLLVNFVGMCKRRMNCNVGSKFVQKR